MKLKLLESFLYEYNEFSIKNVTDTFIFLTGRLRREIQFKEHELKVISYSLTILIPKNYPIEPPIVYENEDKINKIPSNHINPDNSFCLGSPIRLKIVLNKSVDFKDFFEICILPYLYAVTIEQETGGGFIFGELKHGDEGLILDFKELFQLESTEEIYQMLKILSNKKNRSNKMRCPCNCGKRVSRCSYFENVLKMRGICSRIEWKNQYQMIGGA